MTAIVHFIVWMDEIAERDLELRTTQSKIATTSSRGFILADKISFKLRYHFGKDLLDIENLDVRTHHGHEWELVKPRTILMKLDSGAARLQIIEQWSLQPGGIVTPFMIRRGNVSWPLSQPRVGSQIGQLPGSGGHGYSRLIRRTPPCWQDNRESEFGGQGLRRIREDRPIFYFASAYTKNQR